MVIYNEIFLGLIRERAEIADRFDQATRLM